MSDRPTGQGRDAMSDTTTTTTTTARRKGSGKRHQHQHQLVDQAESQLATTSPMAPCGACKFLRRKCISGCIFAPHFGSDQGAARFAAVHKVFGASNVSKLLLHIPVNRRHDAVVTITYEAQQRLTDPVYGCVSTIIALQQQVAALQAELSMVQTQLINTRFAANVLQSSQQQHQQQAQQQHQQQQAQHLGVLQPAYSNNSSASTNLLHMSSFTSSFDLVAETAPSSNSMGPLQLLRPSNDEEENEEESQIPSIFTNEILHHR